MEIKLTNEQVNKLLKEEELYVDFADRTIYISDEGNGKEIIFNYKGEGYRLKSVQLEFEYDESIKF